MVIHQIVFAIFRRLARLRAARTTAYILLLTSRRIRTAEFKPKRDGHRYRGLIMARTGFLEDIKESFLDAEAFELICWPSYALKAFATSILSPTLDHNYYLSDDPGIEATKQDYRSFLAKTWSHFNAISPVDFVLTGNFAYFSEREFGAALESAGVPFIALHKENVRPPRRVKEYWLPLYRERRGKFTGRKILVYNEIERDLEISSGIIETENVIVTGMPRLDRLHRWRRQQAGRADVSRPQVLFFAFSRQDKLTAIQRKPGAGLPGNIEEMASDWGKLSWKTLGEATHRAIISLARARPDLRVIVKTKGQSRKLNDILLMLEEADEQLPSNLELVSGGDPFNLITTSRVVVGFNTTGLLEALAAGRPVIVPWFGEACDDAMSDLIISLGDAVKYAQSPHELIRMITHHADNPADIPMVLPPSVAKALHYWTGNDDGMAGCRVLEAVSNELRHGSTRPDRARR